MDKVSLLAEVLGIPEWYSDAACNTVVHPELNADEWFPERGSSTKKAKEICNSCPVKEPCLEQALERGERFGIWGGKSERERRAIRKERKMKPVVDNDDDSLGDLLR
tara:strand:- start:3891 stop:4211 length:321 start_codon:yes stop_codon:yes gene_type:complete